LISRTVLGHFLFRNYSTREIFDSTVPLQFIVPRATGKPEFQGIIQADLRYLTNIVKISNLNEYNTADKQLRRFLR
jgi:hypothetical protein